MFEHNKVSVTKIIWVFVIILSISLLSGCPGNKDNSSSHEEKKDEREKLLNRVKEYLKEKDPAMAQYLKYVKISDKSDGRMPDDEITCCTSPTKEGFEIKLFDKFYSYESSLEVMSAVLIHELSHVKMFCDKGIHNQAEFEIWLEKQKKLTHQTEEQIFGKYRDESEYEAFRTQFRYLSEILNIYYNFHIPNLQTDKQCEFRRPFLYHFYREFL